MRSISISAIVLFFAFGVIMYSCALSPEKESIVTDSSIEEASQELTANSEDSQSLDSTSTTGTNTANNATTGTTNNNGSGSATGTATATTNTNGSSVSSNSNSAAVTASGNATANAPVSSAFDPNRMDWPDTGQTTSYTTTFGEDNDYSIKTPSYTDNGGTIKDNITKLVWQKIEEKKGVDNFDKYTYKWSAAYTYCDNLVLGAFSDWRLPSIKELSTLVNAEKYAPAINDTYFPDTATGRGYWSSTKEVDKIASRSWSVNFLDGDVLTDEQSSPNRVRCVRGGQ